MQIDTGTHEPIKKRPYRKPLKQRKMVDSAVDEMMQAGIIKRSIHPSGFPIVSDVKKDGIKSWRQYVTKQQLYSHLSPIMKTIQVRRARHAGHYWKSKDKLISDTRMWTPSDSESGAERADLPVSTSA